MTETEARRANLAKGTEVRQARARMKRALAAGQVTAADLVAGASTAWEATAGPMTLEALLRACGRDPVDVLERAGALALRKYRTVTITLDRRREVADALEPEEA